MGARGSAPDKPPGRRSEPRGLSRLEAFSDGVFAIAITLLVLSIDVPDGLGERALARWLANLGPELFSFVLSFLVIGRFWRAHHLLFRQVRGSDDVVLTLNTLFLLSVAFLPVPTAVLGEYGEYPAAYVLYAVSVALCGILLAAIWAYIAHEGRLTADQEDPRARRWQLARFLAAPVVFLASVPAALAGLFFVVIGMWVFLPPLVRLGLRRWHLRATVRGQ